MLPLLRTKTTIPPARPKQVERPRLMARMAEGTCRALTLVVAPAGFGKTTLVTAWAQRAPMPVAWLSLQPADQPRERFLAYLIHALKTVSPYIGQTTLALLQGGSPDGALPALVNDLAEVDGDFALVLDDYHSVDNPESVEILQFLLENRPSAFHILITSRAAPGLNLARLRALDQVTEITEADLRFTEREVRLFIETCMDLRLPEDALAHLNQSTEGWAVGLQLAALSLARQPENWHSLAGQEHIFDYLAQEVLNREPPEVQEFLKISSLFDRFCLPLLEYVLTAKPETKNGNQTGCSPISILSHIERANLFLVSIDDAWFRYHALFTDFLRRQFLPEQAAPYYRLASQWSEQNGLLDEAIHYAVHAADHGRAADLLEGHYRDMLQRGEQAAITEWLESLPPDLIEKRPRLWLARGWASLVAFNTTNVIECIVKAEALLTIETAGEPLVLNETEGLRGEIKFLRFLGDIFAGRVLAADNIATSFTLLDEQDDFLHTLLHFNLGLHHTMQGRTAQAVDAFSETLHLTATLNNPLVAIIAQVQLGEIRQLRGALGLAERTFQQAICYAQETLGEHTFLLGMPYVSYAELLREQNRFDESIQYAEQGIAYCRIWQPAASIDGYITLARLLAAQGRQDEAYTHLETAMQLAEANVSILDDTFIAIQMAQLALLQGDMTRAIQISQAYELEKPAEETYYHVWELAQLVLLRSQTVALLSDPAPAQPILEALSSLIAGAERRERVTPIIEALTLRAYTLHAANRHAEAAADLSRALTLGAQGGYVRIFVDEGRPLQHLLEQYRPQIHAPRAYFDQILGLLRQEKTRYAPRTTHPVVLAPADAIPLTRRELDILELMAAGKSNQEIAVERVLALNTVKKHVANILNKLGVANRTQAVMTARKLGWIE
jgi:LuxR family maltose regulon positive regulatory protein